MRLKLILNIVAVTLIIIGGCTKGRIFTINEYARIAHNYKYNSAVLELDAHIYGVLKTDNEEIIFDSSGGILYRDANIIEGHLISGNDTIIGLNYENIKSVIISSHLLKNIFADTMDLMALSYASYKWQQVDARGGISPLNYILNFNADGLQIDTAGQLVQGKLVDGRLVTIPAAAIKNLRINPDKKEGWIKAGIALSKFTSDNDRHPIGFSPSMGIAYCHNVFRNIFIQPEILVLYNRPENIFSRSEAAISWLESDRFRQIAVECAFRVKYKIKQFDEWSCFISAGPYYARNLISKTSYDSTITYPYFVGRVWGQLDIQNSKKYDYGLSIGLEIDRVFNKKKIFGEIRIDKGLAPVLKKWNSDIKLSPVKRFIYCEIENPPEMHNLRLSLSFGIRIF